jgi:uncharacterized membrane protein
VESPFVEAHGLLRYIGLFLSGVCHQFPEHSLSIAGVQLPLCARCTGTYLGALVGLVNFWWAGRTRASWLPPARVLAVLFACFTFWAIDGLNSYLNYVTGRVFLYTPSNLPRLTAGMLNGLSLSTLVFPMFNFAIWRRPARQRVIRGWGELAGILLQIIAMGWLVQADIHWLLYPLVFLELGGVLLMLTIVNSLIVVLVLRRENLAEHWRQTLPTLGLGMFLSIGEVGGMALLRHVIATALPPPPC